MENQAFNNEIIGYIHSFAPRKNRPHAQIIGNQLPCRNYVALPLTPSEGLLWNIYHAKS